MQKMKDRGFGLLTVLSASYCGWFITPAETLAQAWGRSSTTTTTGVPQFRLSQVAPTASF
jgi:hypothetical protein